MRVKYIFDYRNMLQILSELTGSDIIDSSLLKLRHLTMDCWIPRLTRETRVVLISYDSSPAAVLAMCGCRFNSLLGCPADLLKAQGATASSIEFIQRITSMILELIQSTEYGKLAQITNLDGMVVHKHF